MRPPIFVWKSGTLDVCDSPEELHERYPPSELAQAEVVVCDSRGRAIWISRVASGAWTNAVEAPQPPSPDLLRSILWRYLEGCGTPAEEIESLSLDELLKRACPEDSMRQYRRTAELQGFMAALAVIVVFAVVAYFLDW
jgi:hypothetical protein